ncbi:Peroxinectin A [Neolecta irregularis DAH-3]|uniref:Peroxinectin A n=1 Tax=Neolecta irregularis (strain DAH-3) TaxID=1198029 RepID=A0A1U7LN58_NEOID|nr:Peroxinectin A [Neolecta irregularis DAH-3]|eukprot:OLL23961.1 Peroxinectin A [Neolecta irregularis DAH-3]
MAVSSVALFLLAGALILADPWSHYFHYESHNVQPEVISFGSSDNFVDFIKEIVKSNPFGKIGQVFQGQIDDNAVSLLDLYNSVTVVKDLKARQDAIAHLKYSSEAKRTRQEAEELFKHLGFPLDPSCTAHESKWYYRTLDGSCNWLKAGESHVGSIGYQRERDFGRISYQDGISEPRDGPNPRELSNAFFRKRQTRSVRTPLMLGLLQFITNDAILSEPSSTEFIQVPVPQGDEFFDPDHLGNVTLRVARAASVAGTGTSTSNPRQAKDMSTSWLDGSALYGSTKQVALTLRLFSNGKLDYSVGQDGGQYLPFNDKRLPLRTKPGVAIEDLFAVGDTRANQDWLQLSINTLFLREHNRLCDIVSSQHANWNDEKIYQTVRLLVGSKFTTMANAFQIYNLSESTQGSGYDNFSIFNDPASLDDVRTYPWPQAMKDGRPSVASNEMGITFRFHEMIPDELSIIEANGDTTRVSFSESNYESKRFMEAGLDNILRGMITDDIPNFRSGVNEDFRSARSDQRHLFDIVTSSIVHEREQGIPTFNQYFRDYMHSEVKPVYPIQPRETFEDFSSDPEIVRQLKSLYKSPEDVDLTVGIGLHGDRFPGNDFLPDSGLVIGFLNLFRVKYSDRFHPSYALVSSLFSHCLGMLS